VSKARIVKHLGKGRYKVMLLTDTSIIEAKITALNARIALANTRINGELQDKVDETLAALNAIEIPEDIAELAQLLRAMTFARTAYDNAVNALAQEKFNRENARDEKGKLEGYEPEVERDIWCADYTTNLKPDTEVGVIDWYQYRERSTSGDPVIVPGYLSGKESAYTRVRDGVSVPEISMTTYGWWYAMCLVAGMERQNPHYRKATVTALNADGTVDVTVDEIYTQALGSQAKDLTDDELNLSSVPVHYLGVDSAVFKVNDRVVCEYPRKNFHKDLADSYTAQVTALTARVTALNAKIADYVAQLAALQIIIDALQADIDDKLQAIQDEQTLSGITALQNEITDLDNQISDLKIIIDDANAAISDASSAIAGLNRDIADKNAQLAIYNAELDQLISEGAPPGEIDAKQAQIDGISGEIPALVIERNSQQSILTLADIDRQSADEESQDLQIIRAEKEAVLFALLSNKTITQQELDIALAEMAYQEDKKTKLETKRDGVTALLVDVELQITKLTSFADDELGKYAMLKAFTDTRPVEVTVVGFVDHPRPAEGLAFKDSAGNWKIVMQDGKETSLNTPPALIPNGPNSFNWGVPDDDGYYDHACVWNWHDIRVAGYNYNDIVPSPSSILCAGVIKNTPTPGDITLKVITTSFYTRTFVVKDGSVLSQTGNNFPTDNEVVWDNGIVDGQETGSFPAVPHSYTTQILIDKSGLFAVIANVEDFYLFTNGGPQVPRGGKGKIHIYDLLNYTVTKLSDHKYISRYDTGGSFYGDPATMHNAPIRYVHQSMRYGVDNEITIVALTDVVLINYAGTVKYSEVTFKNRKINIIKELYSDQSQYTFSYPGGISDGYNNISRFLSTIVDNDTLYTITTRRNCPTDTMGVFVGVESLIMPTGQHTLKTGVRGRYDAWVPGEYEAPGAEPLSYDNAYANATVRIELNDISQATVRGFSAGCVKVSGLYSPNMWVEFRGTACKIVDKPSTDYTILI